MFMLVTMAARRREKKGEENYPDMPRKLLQCGKLLVPGIISEKRE
jgi:hypothetical protein